MKKIEVVFVILYILAAISLAAGLSLNFTPAAVSLPALPAEPVLAEKTEKMEETEKTARILFVGDIMLDRGVIYYSEKSAGKNANGFIFEKIHQELLKNDIVVANLEGPITDNESVSISAKQDSPEIFYFTFNPSWAKTLSENNIRLVDLGNNHILNFGGQGLAETKKYLREAGVDYFGAPDYPKSIAIEINGIKVAFISYNEFSAYNKIEAESAIEEIEAAKKHADIIIVFAHWGAEYVPVPADSVRELSHKFIDEGADLIIGSHPHVIQPVEVYKNKRIYYSLGNFIFDQYFSEETKKGLGVVVKIDKEKRLLKFEEINFYTQPNGQTIVENNPEK